MDDTGVSWVRNLDELESVLRLGPMKDHVRVRLCSTPGKYLLMVFDEAHMRDAWLGVVMAGMSDCFRFEPQRNRKVLYVYEK